MNRFLTLFLLAIGIASAGAQSITSSAASNQLAADYKLNVRVATVANITIATALNNGDALDGVTLATGNRVLVKDQSTASQNGIYVVGATPARAADADTWAELPGAFVAIGNEGTVTKNKIFLNTSAPTGTIGSTSITWAEKGAAGAGTGDALVADSLAQFAATTSSQLAGVLSDEEGTGKAIFATGLSNGGDEAGDDGKVAKFGANGELYMSGWRVSDSNGYVSVDTGGLFSLYATGWAGEATLAWPTDIGDDNSGEIATRAWADTQYAPLTSTTDLLDELSTTQGTILYRGAGGWVPLSPGTANHVLKTGGAGADPSWAAGGTGTVTSTGWTGGIVSVANPTTTPAFTIAGTSGGIPYFSGASTWASSAALGANQVVVGGGAGAAPVSISAATFSAAGAFADSVNGAASTPAAYLSGTWYSGGTATTTKPQFLVQPSAATSTGWSTAGTGIGVNAASGFTGNLLDSQLNGASVFSVGYNGLATIQTTATNPAIEIKGTTVPDFTGVGFGPNVTTQTTSRLSQASVANGGASLIAFTANTNVVPALSITGYLGSTSPTQPAVAFDAYKHNGTTGRAAVASTELTAQWRNAGTALISLRGDGLLQLQGSTTSFPAIKRSGTTVAMRLADDSADCPVSASSATLSGSLTVPKTVTASGTTGAQTIDKMSGAVNFAAAATSLVVTCNLVTTSSVIIATVGSNDATMKSVAVVAGSGSFTIYPDAAPTAETRVNFLITN